MNRPFKLNPYRWGTIFGTLSLDLVSPYISDMGLQLPAGDVFMRGLREIIQTFRGLEAQQPGGELPFARAVFQWATKEFGPQFAGHLYDWGENVFQTGESGVDVFVWNNIVRRGGLDGSRDMQPPPEFVRLLRAKLAQRQPPSFNGVSPTTPWDRELYNRQGYDRLRNPSELVEATIRHYNFLEAWNQTVKEAPEKLDLKELYLWGLREAQSLGMPPDRVREPGSWLPLPQPWR